VAIDLPVTSLAALLNGLLFLALTVRVIAYRRGQRIVLGDNNDRVLIKRMRGHGNAAEQMPIALILLALCELQGAGAWPLLITAGVFTVGRMLHGVYFTFQGIPWPLRFYGMVLTLTAQAALLVLLLWTQLAQA